MTSTITKQTVEATFSVRCADGVFSTVAVETVEVRSDLMSAVDVHKALGRYLHDNEMPSAVYGFEFNGQFRKDRWSKGDGDFVGCTCDGAKGDPACDMYACWGRAPRS